MTSRVLVAVRVHAPVARVFEAFTAEIGEWWRPNTLFRFTGRVGVRIVFEPGPAGRLLEVAGDGETFEIGRVRAWDPPTRLVFGWRQAGFPAGRETEVHVRFEPTGPGTRVTVEHLGWDAIPQDNVARHGFPLAAFQHRLAEWWQSLLAALGERVDAMPG